MSDFSADSNLIFNLLKFFIFYKHAKLDCKSLFAFQLDFIFNIMSQYPECSTGMFPI